VGPDDVLVGMPSSGLHANGYSLVREAVLDRHDLASTPAGLSRPLADELLEPCSIYAQLVLGLARDDLVHAAAHITGGGLVENLPRALPEGLGAEIERDTWVEPEVFSFVQRESGAGDGDMFATFNMGLGMVLVVAPDRAAETVARVPGASRIGRVVPGTGVRVT
jgi:phosphoribosylformylglycinamidine cyclo-ligase